MNSLTFKIILVGEGGVGKTTFIKQHQTQKFTKKYIPTMGVEVSPLLLKTNKGSIILNIWDTAGLEKYEGLKDGYYIGADACILMFDVTSELTYNKLQERCIDIIRIIGKQIPIILCGNKVDCKDRKVKPIDIKFHKENNLYYYLDMSVKNNYNFEKPFLYLIKKLLKDENVTCAEED